MYNNIAFIGGIHGVGKSTICRKICDELHLEYLSASDLLKWGEINQDSKNKNVANIQATQDRLEAGLVNTVKTDKHYLLDGHYCLLNLDNKVVRVPFDTFKMINPVSLNLMVENTIDIKSRLEKRDKKSYSLELLQEMQDSELVYAKELSKKLGVNLNTGSQKDFTEILTSLYKSFVGK